MSGWHQRIADKADANGICICTVEDLPSWHFVHRGVRHGYRYCRSFHAAVVSNVYWHNESINVWSHIIASIVILGYFFGEWPEVIENTKGTEMDKIVIFCVVVLGNVMPLLTSAICHNFYCLNQRTHKYCWFLDFFGILTGMFICGLGYVYFAFYCHKIFVGKMVLFLSALFVVAAMWCWVRFSPRMDAVMLTPRDRFPEFSFSLSSYIVFASFIPLALAWIYQTEYWVDERLFWAQLQSTLAPAFLTVGVFLFAQGAVPERFFRPHILDMAGHSHQLWHLVTASVMFLLVDGLVDHFHSRVDFGCPAPR